MFLEELEALTEKKTSPLVNLAHSKTKGNSRWSRRQLYFTVGSASKYTPNSSVANPLLEMVTIHYGLEFGESFHALLRDFQNFIRLNTAGNMP